MHRRDGQFDHQLMPVGMQSRNLDTLAEHGMLTSGQVFVETGIVRTAQRFRDDQLSQGQTQHLAALMAEGALGGFVELNDQTVGVDNDDAIERRLDERRPKRGLDILGPALKRAHDIAPRIAGLV